MTTDEYNLSHTICYSYGTDNKTLMIKESNTFLAATLVGLIEEDSVCLR